MANDTWRTPSEVFETLDREFNFLADMACTNENKLCDLGFTEDQDSLSFSWSGVFLEEIRKNGTPYVWLNCPYSNPMPWVKKAALEQLEGLGTVMLLNADTSVGWFAEALKTVSEIRFIVADKKESGKGEYSSGRLAFLDQDGRPAKGNNKPQFILVFNPHKVGARVTNYVNKRNY